MSMLDRRRLLALLIAAAVPVPAMSEPLPLIELPGAVPAPDFILPDLSGNSRRLSDYRGRPVLVSFWAVWCPPCRRELAELAELNKRLADTRIAILAVNLGDSAVRVTNFLADHPAPDLLVLIDADKSAAAPWHVHALPVVYAVAPDGALRLGAIGERDWRAPVIERQLRALIGSRSRHGFSPQP
jgi:thiol-disulfide isomerase/thioredoxin